LSAKGERLKGVPNSDFNIPFILALAPNSASGFARLSLNPLDPKYQGNGRTITDSNNQLVKLPDPQKFEDAFDDALLQLPAGNFESSPDGISNTTQIPSMFTFKTGPYTADGQFAVGPFAGLSAFTNAVHSSEIDLPSAAQLSGETLKIDREVYLGTILQNAADPRLRLPENQTVKPSEWLRQISTDPAQAELADQIPTPGAGEYPNLRPSLVSYNGLLFSPNTNNSKDIASGSFFAAVNAMAAWQNSLQPPANQSPENQLALQNGSVRRGAVVFQNANCASCHKAPFFTDNIIHPVSEIKTNPARAKSRLGLNKLLVAPKLYPFDTPVPIPANTKMLDVPTAGITESPTTLPKGILPDGGYKTTSLLGLNFSAPYLHDSGVAVRKDSLKVNSDGSFTVVDVNGLGLPGTLSQGRSADSSNSLRALFDRELRAKVIAANKANPGLIANNLDGTGHEFYVDRPAGFTTTQQTDLINFLMALDNDPGKF
jgi:Di-haem oxidoreductase, putative peroxidase